jgi:hypothetical protein
MNWKLKGRGANMSVKPGLKAKITNLNQHGNPKCTKAFL